ITGAWDASSGTLTLSGTASVAQYEAALRSVRYVSLLGEQPGDERLIEISVSDGELNSGVETRTIDWPAGGPALPPTQTPPTVTPPPSPDIPVSTVPKTHAPEPVAPPPSPVAGLPTAGGGGGSAQQTPAQPAPAPQPPPVPPPIFLAPAPPPAVEYAPPTAPPPPPAPVPPPTLPVPPPTAAPVAQQPVYQTPVFIKQLDTLARELETPTKQGVINVGSVAGMTSMLLSDGYAI